MPASRLAPACAAVALTALASSADAANLTPPNEYVSANWARSAAGAPQPAFQADTDESYLDEELIALGVVWRYLRAKGLDYAEELASYEREVEQALARDGGSDSISMAPRSASLGRLNLPDGGFGA